MDKNLQPIFKLHGSTNWRTPVGDNMLVLGAEKTQQIENSRLLQSYVGLFEMAGTSILTVLSLSHRAFQGPPHRGQLSREA